MWHTYTMEDYSTIKEWNDAICSNMDAPGDYHAKWNQTEKDKYHDYCLYVEYQNDTNEELSYKREIDSQM